MNYFAHGQRFLDRPYFLAGISIPDWMNVVNRRVRVRSKAAAPYLADTVAHYRDLAGGVVQHHEDDRWFHQTRSFAELSLDFAVQLRDALPEDEGFRPSFLGHILVEILMDACLIEDAPEDLDRYYAALARTDPVKVAQFVTVVTGKDVHRLADFIPRFLDARFLYDYADNAKLLFRLNQVMRRVGLAPLSHELLDLLPSMKSTVRGRLDALAPSAEST